MKLNEQMMITEEEYFHVHSQPSIIVMDISYTSYQNRYVEKIDDKYV